MTQVRIGIANDNERFLKDVLGRLHFRNGWRTVVMPNDVGYCGQHGDLHFFAGSQREVLSLVQSGGYGLGFQAGIVRSEGVVTLLRKREVRVLCTSFLAKRADRAEVVIVTSSSESVVGYEEKMALLQQLVDAIEAWPKK